MKIDHDVTYPDGDMSTRVETLINSVHQSKSLILSIWVISCDEGDFWEVTLYTDKNPGWLQDHSHNYDELLYRSVWSTLKEAFSDYTGLLEIHTSPDGV